MEQGEIEVLLELGQSYLLNKEYENAIKKFGEALKINPHDPEVYYYLGLAYEGDNKLEDAINMYEKTLGLDETFNNAEIRLNKLKDKMNEKPEKSGKKSN
ncbi:tetratricopeptide repeat protein [candidate division WOR-3 bacterium]|nr:tetratricopeptide repeat protein [candidate division WOR-3 bacterium]